VKNDLTVTNIFDLGAQRYPHLKLTGESFPRVIATRRIEGDEAEYFGAMLPRTAVRILIDFINKTFKLRSCDIEIDGSFPMPCTQFYRRRCVAPCVASLCSTQRYDEIVSLVRSFLRNDEGKCRSSVKSLISAASDELDFENAAVYRDILEAIERYWNQDRWQVWLDDAIDTYAIEETPAGFAIYLVTHRGRGVLGRKVFRVDREDAETPDEALAQIIRSFYVVHLPKEIRVPHDFYRRKELIADLSERFSKQAIIRVFRPGVNASRGLNLSHDEEKLDRAKPHATPDRIAGELKKRFDLQDKPLRVEAFDVAHISGTGFVAASAVWDNGRFLSADYSFEISHENSELAALAAYVESHVLASPRPPDLVVLDGGKPQMSTVLKQLKYAQQRPPMIAAVKPKGRHSAVSHFLTEDGESHPFDIDSPAHAMLQLLRDEAHDLSNRAHRDWREMMPFYERAGHEHPLVVPLRFHAENGGADDLIPIESR
jgi:excinuclease ABC subunit C